MKQVLIFMLLLIASITYSQSIAGKTVQIEDMKKRCTISASAIKAKANLSWTTDLPVAGKWSVVYENKEYTLLLDNNVLYKSALIDGVRSHYKASLLRFVN